MNESHGKFKAIIGCSVEINTEYRHSGGLKYLSLLFQVRGRGEAM
jgi:hypothetical protein